MNFIEIKEFKFSANLEFVSEELQKRSIIHYTDNEKNILLAEEKNRSEILKIIENLNLDENDVEVDESSIQGYKEWNQNMYNPGHYTGGHQPSFERDKDNYLMYGFVVLVSGLAALVGIVNDNNFSKTGFWVSFWILITISCSLFYQYYKFKKK